MAEVVFAEFPMHFSKLLPGGESTHNFASFSYTSFCGVINFRVLDEGY